MKTALLVYVAGSFLIITVFGGGVPVPNPEPSPTPTPTPAIKCGCNMVPTSCNPCNQVCNEEPRMCALFCVEDVRFCACKPGHRLRTKNSKSCIPDEKCPKPKPTCLPDHKSG